MLCRTTSSCFAVYQAVARGDGMQDVSLCYVLLPAVGVASVYILCALFCYTLAM